MITSTVSSQIIWPSRRWWFILLVIIVFAALLRFTGYNYSLPFVAHVDEPAYNIAGRMMIDFGSAKPLGMQGYPPGIVYLNYVIMRLFQQPNTPPGSILWIIRLIVIIFSVATIIVLALLAFRISIPLGGLLAALFCAVNPELVEHSRYATADNFVTFFTTIAFFLVLTGTHYNRNGWINAGQVAIIFAILFKYQAVFVLPLLMVVPLSRLYKNSVNRREVLNNFAMTIFIQTIFFAWLILLYPALEAGQSPYWSASKFSVPSLSIILGNYKALVNVFSSVTIWAIGLPGILFFLLPSLRQYVNLFGLVVLIIAALSWLVGISFYGVQSIRQLLWVLVLLALFSAVGLVGWALVIAQILERHKLLRLPVPMITVATSILAAAGILSLIPHISASIDNAYNHTLPDRRNDLALWADQTLIPGKYIANVDNHKTFNREWGGYTGIKQFPLEEMKLLSERSLDEWRTRDVMYAIVPYEEYIKLKEKEPQQLTNLTLLKAYPPSQQYRDPGMAVFRLYPVQYKLDSVLGSIHVMGYDIDRKIVLPGESITFNIYWQAESPPVGDYAVFNHLINVVTGELAAQADNAPMSDARRPTFSWTDPDETLMSQPFILTVGKNVAPGTYHLITGFYDRETGIRLVTPDNLDSVLITEITVSN